MSVPTSLDVPKSSSLSLSPGVSEQAFPRGHALSNKVTSILSASYADIEIRDALETLDIRRLRNTTETRRDLRRDVQKEIIDANSEIVRDFGDVALQLKSVGDALSNLQRTCAEIRKHVSSARTETKPMLDEASVLVQQKQQLETKQNVLYKFNTHFLLSEEETRTLTSAAEPVNDAFFQALVKAKRIHKDSRLLLGGENQRLGLEILDQSSKNLNSAFQKLYRWIQREFKSLDLENPRINASIRRALRVLAERPSLFQNCLDIFAESRERSLSNAFFAALTGSSHNGEVVARPIDMSASEPLRYVGDMLAWAHSTTVSEREALEGLFISEGDEIAKGIKEGLESEPWSRPTDEDSDSDNDDNRKPTTDRPKAAFDGRTALAQLVNRSLAGVAHLLRERIEQVVHTQDDSVLCYKIAKLIVFYRNIFTRLVNESGFLETLDRMEASALDRFGTTMRFSISNLQAEISSAPDNLNAPDFLSDAMDAFAQLLKSYETSLASSVKAADSRPGSSEVVDPSEPGLRTLYEEALEPYITTLRTIATMIRDPTSASIFIHNSISIILPVLRPYSSRTTPKISELAMLQSGQIQILTECIHAFLLLTSGLQRIVSRIPPTFSVDEEGISEPIRKISAAKTSPYMPADIAEISAQLNDFLPNAIIDAEAELGQLQDKVAMREVVNGAAELFVNDFGRVEAFISKLDAADREINGDVAGDAEADKLEDEEGVGSRRAVWPRTVEEVAVLLS